MVFMEPNSLLQPAVKQAVSTIWLCALIPLFLIVARLAFRAMSVALELDGAPCLGVDGTKNTELRVVYGLGRLVVPQQ
jgi:hypothetical protein